jgi:hypothetical protein
VQVFGLIFSLCSERELFFCQDNFWVFATNLQKSILSPHSLCANILISIQSLNIDSGGFSVAEWAKEARARFEKPPGWSFNTIVEEPITTVMTNTDVSCTITQPVAGRAVEVGVLAATHLPLTSSGEGATVDCWCVVSFAGAERETARSSDPDPKWGERFTFELELACGGVCGGSDSKVTAVRPGRLQVSLFSGGGRKLGDVIVPAERMGEVVLAPKGWGEERFRVVMAAEGSESSGLALAGRGLLRCELLVSMRILEAGEWPRYHHRPSISV